MQKTGGDALTDAAPDADLSAQGPEVTHLLSQRFGPQTSIAAVQADGHITVWREDGSFPF